MDTGEEKNRKDLDIYKIECIESVFSPTLSAFTSDVSILPRDLVYKPFGCPTCFVSSPMRSALWKLFVKEVIFVSLKNCQICSLTSGVAENPRVGLAM